MTETATGIYLDYNATTPCDARVVEKMLPYFSEIYGNPSNGLHQQGRISSQAIEMAREKVADLIQAHPSEIIFTSGATESDNLAILGFARMNKNATRRKIVTSSIEHKAVLLACEKLLSEGFELEVLPVNEHGMVSLEAAEQAINEKTLLVTIHAANNEIGTIQSIKQISQLAHLCGAMFHSDAAQAVGKMHVNVDDWGVDLMSISAHKLYGPKGVGVLYIRNGINALPLESIWFGGGQESGLRSGTMNVPSIVGFGEAAHIAKYEMENDITRIGHLRELLESQLVAQIPSLIINGCNAPRLPNTSSQTFPGVDADALIFNSPQIMVGTGSACTSGAIEPSHVLSAIGLNRDLAASTIRLSLGRYTSEKDVVQTTQILTTAWKSLTSQND